MKNSFKIHLFYAVLLLGFTSWYPSEAQCPDQGRLTFSMKPKDYNLGELHSFYTSYTEYRHRYDSLWSFGFRLHDLDVALVNGSKMYSAIWEYGTEAEYQIYEATYAAYINYFNSKYPLGYRVQILSNYVDANGTTRYTAVFRRTYENYTAVYEVSASGLIAQYNSLISGGWRIKTITSFVKNGQLLYSAVFESSNSPEAIYLGYSEADFASVASIRRNSGYEVINVETVYLSNGELRYSATFRPSSLFYNLYLGGSTNTFFSTNPHYSTGYGQYRIDRVSIVGPPSCIVARMGDEAQDSTGMSAETGNAMLATSSANGSMQLSIQEMEQGVFNISFDNPDLLSQGNIQILDMSGVPISSVTEGVSMHPGRNSVSVNLNNQSPGIYLVKLAMGGKFLTGKLIYTAR